MKQFKPSALSLALMLGGVTLASMPTFAAEEEEVKAEEADIEVIEIKGFRRSLIESLNTKRYSDTVVEAVSADDMGALPDVSIADAISRLPGVTAVRSGGQSSELNIRGMSGGFVFSTLNGREVVTDEGGRSVQFDQYPSELINQVQVYKSQKASLVEGGVAGSIELKTANALENDEDHSFVIQTKLSYNDSADEHPDADPLGNRFSFSYQGKFLDETLGLSLGYARLQQPKISTQYVNYQPRVAQLPIDGLQDGGLTLEDPTTGETGPGWYVIPQGFELMARGGEELREGIMGSLVFQPNDDLQIKGDVFYSKFDSQGIDRGYRINGLGSIGDGNSVYIQNPIFAGDNNEFLVGGSYYRDPAFDDSNNPPYPRYANTLTMQTQADDNTTNSEVMNVGINVEYIINDELTMSFDAAHSRGESDYRDEVMRLWQSTDATAAMPIVNDEIVVHVENNGLNLPNISFNQAFQNGLVDPTKMMVGSLEKYPHLEENEANSARLDFKYSLDTDFISSIETGVRWADRKYENRRQAYNYCDIANYGQLLRNGQYVLGYDDMGNPETVCAPYQLQAGDYEVVQLEGEFADFPAFISVDNTYIESVWLAGQDTQARQDWRYDWTIWQESLIEEETFAFYLQANLDMELFGLPLTGNIGARVIRTEQSATGVEDPVEQGNGDPITDDLGITRTTYLKTTLTEEFTDVLPSMNLNLQLTENDQLRFAVAKVMSRPDMADMAVSGAWSFDADEADGGQIKANLNRNTSPEVRPFYATQFDLSYEHYFTETEGALVFALYYKDIESFPEKALLEDYDFVGNGITPPAVNPNTGVPVPSGDYNVLLNNGKGGYFRGAEVAYTQTFSFLPGIWEGLGISASYSYTDSEVTSQVATVSGLPETTSPYPFLSPRVWTAAIFFDWDDTFSTRLNARYREEYVGNQIAIGDQQKAFFAEELVVDYQASWQFTEELQGIFSVNNVTDEPNRSYFGNQAATGTLQYFGRQFYFGLNAKF